MAPLVERHAHSPTHLYAKQGGAIRSRSYEQRFALPLPWRERAGVRGRAVPRAQIKQSVRLPSSLAQALQYYPFSNDSPSAK